ncbi:methyltransferase domain-containing protein [Streptomyces sp. NPDC097619]|uniref:class I SAM-dependent methyltransferase n=1 Tax=Streptomyces sp. NPDC097619 TaxID=3157228 RepID=UPI00332E19F7
MTHGAQDSFPEIDPAVRETYGPADLSREPVFAGGFINFGHWADIDLTAPLGEAERIRSQQDLYRRVLDAAGPQEGRRVLEVGCGLGMGSALTLEERSPAAVTAMDVHPQQLERARSAHAGLLSRSPERLVFARGAAERMPFPDAAFDTVISVEAAQHFPDLDAFAAETARVLAPGGRVAVATFFTPDDAPAHAAELARLLHTFETGLDRARPVGALTAALTAAGLTEARAHSLGPAVWAGWDRWLSRLWAADTWPRNFLRAHERGHLDYYLVTAVRT